jgi:hypothetical protein
MKYETTSIRLRRTREGYIIQTFRSIHDNGTMPQSWQFIEGSIPRTKRGALGDLALLLQMMCEPRNVTRIQIRYSKKTRTAK